MIECYVINGKELFPVAGFWDSRVFHVWRKARGLHSIPLTAPLGLERRVIAAMLEDTHGNVRAAARRLAMSTGKLYRRIAAHHLEELVARERVNSWHTDMRASH